MTCVVLCKACCASEEFIAEEKEEEVQWRRRNRGLLRRRVQSSGHSCWHDASRAREFVTGVEEQELVHFGSFVSSKGLASSREAE